MEADHVTYGGDMSDKAETARVREELRKVLVDHETRTVETRGGNTVPRK